MKRLRILVLALFAVFAFSAIVTSMALGSEEELAAEWLVGGIGVAAALATTVSGELLLEDTKVPLVGKAAVLCDGLLDGTINVGGVDEITELLTLTGVLVPTTVLTGTALLCKSESTPVGCEESTTDIEVWAENLPWKTLLTLMDPSGKFLDRLFKEPETGPQPAYELKCLIGGLTAEDLCEGVTSAEIVNLAGGGVEPVFSSAAPVESELATCTVGGVGSGLLQSEGTENRITVDAGGVLTVSEEAEKLVEEELAAEWLVGGVAVAVALAATVSGELLLEDTKVPLVGKAAVLCDGLLDGTIGPGDADEITELLTLVGVLVPTTVLTGTALLCKAEATPVGCEESATDIEVWAENLPWKTLLTLMDPSGKFLDRLFKEPETGPQPAYELKCLFGGLTAEDLCEGVTSAEIVNLAGGGVEPVLNPVAPAESQPVTCTASGAGSGLLQSEGTENRITVHTGGVLTVSEEKLVEEELTAEWLSNGAAIVDTLATTMSGELLLEDMNIPVVGVRAVLCDGLLDGTIGPGDADEITELLTLGGVLVPTTVLTGTALLCKAEATPVGCEESATDIEVWAENLPWKTLLTLMDPSGKFLDRLFKEPETGPQPAYELKCLFGGLTVEDLCEGVTSAEIVNLAGGGVEPVLNPVAPAESQPVTCTASGAGSGLLQSEGTENRITINAGGVLTASE